MRNEYLDRFMAQFPFEGLTYDDVTLVTQYADFRPHGHRNGPRRRHRLHP